MHKRNTTSKQIDDIFTRHGNPHLKHVAPIILLRGGSTGTIDRKDSTIVSSLSVVVSTSFGSSFLDKKKKFTLASNSTIFDLKEQIASKFPGSPPVEIQQLYFSSRHLIDDSELVSNISSMQPVPILLDVISGNSVYNRTLSIRQSLEAYVSTVVQQSFIGKKLNSLYSRSLSPVEAVSAIQMEAIAFRSMFHELNDTLYTSYGEEIRAALQAERDPETTAADTAAWRDPNRKKASPLTAALAKEFDLNVRGLVNFLYYSLVLMVRYGIRRYVSLGDSTHVRVPTCIAVLRLLRNDRLVAVAAAASHRAADVGVQAAAAATARQGISYLSPLSVH